MSCPRWSDRGAAGWSRKFAAAANVTQDGVTNGRLGFFFANVEFAQTSFFSSNASCQPASSVLRSCIRADRERDPVRFVVPCPGPLCSPLHGAATVDKQQHVGSRGAEIY